MTVSAQEDIREELFFAMAAISCPILEMRMLHTTLEDAFLALTDGGAGEKSSEADGENEPAGTPDGELLSEEGQAEIPDGEQSSEAGQTEMPDSETADKEEVISEKVSDNSGEQAEKGEEN
jgi:hypothetical protein